MTTIYTVTVFDDRTEWRNAAGELHRDGGLPAVEWNDGSRFYYVNGKCHRDGGLPAIEYTDGDMEWWMNGKQITEAEAKKLAIKPDNCDGKIVEIDGKKYQLKEM